MYRDNLRSHCTSYSLCAFFRFNILYDLETCTHMMLPDATLCYSGPVDCPNFPTMMSRGFGGIHWLNAFAVTIPGAVAFVSRPFDPIACMNFIVFLMVSIVIVVAYAVRKVHVLPRPNYCLLWLRWGREAWLYLRLSTFTAEILSVFISLCLLFCVYVCMCVFVCLCVRMYVCLCMCVCVFLCVYVCICVCVCLYVFVCVCMYMCVCVCMYVCMYVCVYVCMYICMYVCMYVCLYVWMYVCVYVCMCVS